MQIAHSLSSPEDVHALDLEALCADEIVFFTARAAGKLLGMGALRKLSDEHYEIKSMHTSAAARRTGVARAMVEHLATYASSVGATRVSLETGTMDEMAPARELYASCGFDVCKPFGDYRDSPASLCMTRMF